MNTEYFSIGCEQDYIKGRSANALLPLNTPENTRDVPCEGCAHIDSCAARATECVAFRQWTALGDYLDKDVMRLLRVPRGV